MPKVPRAAQHSRGLPGPIDRQRKRLYASLPGLRSMSTAEFAELRAGDDPYRVSPAYRLILARRVALLIYATAFVTAAFTWGVPLQTQLVIAWTCGALACASATTSSARKVRCEL